MNTVTLSLEDYNSLLNKEKAFEQLKKDTYAIRVYHNYYTSSSSYYVLNKDEAIQSFSEEVKILNEKIINLHERLTEKDKSLWQRLFN